MRMLLLGVAALLVGCASTSQVSHQSVSGTQYNPCSGQQYQELTKKPIAEMSPQEYDYYVKATEYCEQSREDGARKAKRRKLAPLWIALGACSAIGLFFGCFGEALIW